MRLGAVSCVVFLAAAVSASAADVSQGTPSSQPAPIAAQPASPYDAGVTAYNAGKFTDAAKNWRQAANAGDPRAQFGMGQLYEQGRGVIQSRVQAHAWYNLAASQGLDVATEARDRLTKGMTSDELAKAQQQAEALQTGTPASSAPMPAAAPAVAAASPQELFKAAEAGDVAKLHAILASGTDVNATDADGWTALFFATAKNQKDAVQALIAAKANVNVRGKKNGETPLMVAALVGSADIVKLLVQAKADQSARDAKGRTARDIADLKGEKQVAGLLRGSGTSGNRMPDHITSDTPESAGSAQSWINGSWVLLPGSNKPNCTDVGNRRVYNLQGIKLTQQEIMTFDSSKPTRYTSLSYTVQPQSTRSKIFLNEGDVLTRVDASHMIEHLRTPGGGGWDTTFVKCSG